MRRKHKHLTWDERLTIERMHNNKFSVKEIQRAIGCSLRTIYREIKRGEYDRLDSEYRVTRCYSPDIAHDRYREHLAAKGPSLKIGNDFKFVEYIEDCILNKKWSPDVLLGRMKYEQLPFKTSISTRTLYSYIDKGIFLNVTNNNLWRKPKQKPRNYKKIKKAARPSAGTSIERRSKEVTGRQDYGHWEMDTVRGKQRGKKQTLLVLTERKARHELLFPLPDSMTKSVVSTLNRLEYKYGKDFTKIFKSITVDNGSEFADCQGLENSKKGKRTQLYYCHPYSSYERGSNEVANAMIRRFVPKGTDFAKIPKKQWEWIQHWMNNYPRKIHGYRTASELFEEFLASLQTE